MGAFGLKKEVVSRGVVIWQTVLETAQGGFVLDQSDLTPDTIIPAGTVIGYDESTRKATVLKTASLQAAATNTTTTYQVVKGHSFKVGDNVTAKKSGAAFSITAIDVTNPAYDVLTLGTTLGIALPVGAALFQSSTNGANGAAFVTTPKGLLYEDLKVVPNVDLAIVIRGTVYARRIPAVADDIKAAMPLLVFSQSY